MPLVVNGSAAQRATIESWLREICWSVSIDPATGAVAQTAGPPGPGQSTTGCACIAELISGGRTVTIHPMGGPGVPIPGGGDYVVSPERKLSYIDQYVARNGGRLAGINTYLDLRYDQLHVSIN